MTLIGVAGFGISGGWAVAGPTRARGRLLLSLAAMPLVSGTALALAGPVAGAVSLGGLLFGLASRLLLDFSLAQRQPHQGGTG